MTRDPYDQDRVEPLDDDGDDGGERLERWAPPPRDDVALERQTHTHDASPRPPALEVDDDEGVAD